jgi:L-fuculokinase
VSHTLVLDIGKSNAKLLLIDEHGEVLSRHVQANEPVAGPGYLALGTGAIEAWLLRTIPALPERSRIGRISISTHGAAFCAVDGEGLVLPPIDYEWDGYGAHREAFHRIADPFAQTGSPDLPLGLNAGLQLYWLHQARPTEWKNIHHWLPYPQYWAWWFSGVAAIEVSSLGCHTHLWSPARNELAAWTRSIGLVDLFPPLKHAWDGLGPVKPGLAAQLGLPADCIVHAGVHDSNACLARHLRAVPGGIVVSTGTWCVVMAPGAPLATLAPGRDQLVNVSVECQAVPTARFMGGREFSVLCAGADPSLATLAALDEVLDQGWAVTPSFAESGGPHQGSRGRIWQHGKPWAPGIAGVPQHLRPALAALYGAHMTAELVESLSTNNAAPAPVVVEGPLADNEVYGAGLSACLGHRELLRSTDALEGTARGAWMLADWPARAGLAGWYEALPVVPDSTRRRLARYRAAATGLSIEPAAADQAHH